MSNSSSLTSITCKLTPSTSNLDKVEATASKLLFTMRSLHFWGRCLYVVISDVQKQATESQARLRQHMADRRAFMIRAPFLSLRFKSKEQAKCQGVALEIAAPKVNQAADANSADQSSSEWQRTRFGGQDAIKGSRKNFKILIVSKNANDLRHCFYLF